MIIRGHALGKRREEKRRGHDYCTFELNCTSKIKKINEEEDTKEAAKILTRKQQMQQTRMIKKKSHKGRMKDVRKKAAT